MNKNITAHTFFLFNIYFFVPYFFKKQMAAPKEGGKPGGVADGGPKESAANRGKVIAVIGDEDTVVGFILGGVGQPSDFIINF